jgi:hypothetical protein
MSVNTKLVNVKIFTKWELFQVFIAVEIIILNHMFFIFLR